MCGKDSLADFGIMLFALGTAMGAFIFSILADKIGRKPVYLVCMWISVALAVAKSLSPSYTVFMIFMFLEGVHQQVNR